MAYSLGAVKPHVAAAANSVGPMFGIRVIYGWVPGTYDHPKGLALDFMTSSKATGDALSAYVVSNASSLGVTYVIWYRRIWNAQKGWHPYVVDAQHPSPHTDHVHVSFSPVAGTGITNVGLGNVLPGSDVLSKVNDSLRYLTTAGGWKRIGIFFGGAALITIGVLRLSGAKTVVSKTVSAARKVAS